MEILEKLKYTDLGSNVFILNDVASDINNGVFVDLGVREGNSSSVFLIGASDRNNIVYGVDVEKSAIRDEVLNNSNYNFILGDSVTVGKNWDGPDVDLLFIDTFHIKEQVLCELFFWIDKMKENSYIVLHDTNWPVDKNDRYGNVVWDRPEDAIKDFFKIDSLDYQDDFIEVNNYPSSWGMTVIKIKNKKEFKKNIKDWSHIFERRNYLISIFWNENNSKSLQIELNI